MDNLAYKDESRYEMVQGKTFMMSPSPTINHSTVAGNIHTIFNVYLKGKPCRTFSDNVDVHFDDKNIFIPDVTIICNSNIIKSNGIYGAPDLVVEILSPSTSRRDRKEKKDIYEKYGVKEYWLASSADKSIEVYLFKDGKLTIDNVYNVYPDYLLEKMTEAEKSNIITELKTSLFEDLIIRLKDVFEHVI